MSLFPALESNHLHTHSTDCSNFVSLISAIRLFTLHSLFTPCHSYLAADALWTFPVNMLKAHVDLTPGLRCLCRAACHKGQKLWLVLVPIVRPEQTPGFLFSCAPEICQHLGINRCRCMWTWRLWHSVHGAERRLIEAVSHLHGSLVTVITLMFIMRNNVVMI